MNEAKSKAIYILPKLIVFALAFYNFISLWFASNVFTGIACAACPWYFDWSYINEPSVLLLAASFLLLNKFRSYLASFGLSGFILVKGLYLINKSGWTEWIDFLQKQWETRIDLETEILKIWEIQIVLALIIFSSAVFYIILQVNRNRSMQ